MPVPRNALAVLLLTVSMAAVAGCDGSTGGSASAAPPSGSSATPARPTTTSALPARPREIKLDGLDPCMLWTPEQLAQLAVQPSPVDGGPQEDAGGYQVCSYRTPLQADTDLGYSVTAVTDLDATVYLGDSDSAEAKVVEVGGFPSVQETTEPDNASPCMLAISTAPGQHLQIRAETRPGGYSVPQSCELTMKAATLAVQTLQTLR
jgi:hypothetical protein